MHALKMEVLAVEIVRPCRIAISKASSGRPSCVSTVYQRRLENGMLPQWFAFPSGKTGKCVCFMYVFALFDFRFNN